MAYKDLMTPEEMAEYRAKKAREREEAATAKAKAEEKELIEQGKKARAELEADLKRRWLASGGTLGEFESERRRLVRDALAAKVLAPDEPADTTPVIEPPISKRRMLTN